MKKLKVFLLMILILISSAAISQSVFNQIVLESGYDISTTGDTLLAKDYTSNRCSWQYDIYWSSLTGTLDGIIYMKTTSLPDSLVVDSAYVRYPNIAVDTLNVANGYCSFTDGDFTGTRTALFLDKNNLTGGTIKIYRTRKVY